MYATLHSDEGLLLLLLSIWAKRRFYEAYLHISISNLAQVRINSVPSWLHVRKKL